MNDWVFAEVIRRAEYPIGLSGMPLEDSLGSSYVRLGFTKLE